MLVNDELGRIWKESAFVRLRILSQYAIYMKLTWLLIRTAVHVDLQL